MKNLMFQAVEKYVNFNKIMPHEKEFVYLDTGRISLPSHTPGGGKYLRVYNAGGEYKILMYEYWATSVIQYTFIYYGFEYIVIVGFYS